MGEKQAKKTKVARTSAALTSPSEIAERRAALNSSGGTFGGRWRLIRGTVGAGPGSSTSDGAAVL